MIQILLLNNKYRKEVLEVNSTEERNHAEIRLYAKTYHGKPLCDEIL